MSKYSDHTTIGGQVLAHRVRMMRQNWNVIWIVGRVSCLLSFIFYLMAKWKINDIWNYLVCLKAFYRNDMTTLPSSLFSSSHFWFRSGRWQEVSDYAIANNQAFFAMKTNFESSLWFGLKLAVCVGIASMILMIVWTKYFGKSLSDSKELLSGHDYVNADKIKKYIKQLEAGHGKSDITLADVPYPQNTECRHTILTGTTGSGKTNVMIELLDQIVTKNEKIVIVDTIGTFVNRYYNKDRDIILNPLDEDKRCVPWSFLSECTGEEILIKNVAACLIDSGITHDKFWEDAARIVFSETAKKTIAEGKTTAEFLNILLKMPLKEIEKYLQGTYGHTLMDSRADKMAISVRATLINAVSIFDSLKEADSKSDNFSIKDWMTNPNQKGILFLSCTPAHRATLIPIITAWLSITTEYLLHIAPTQKRTWFFIDELHNLKRLPRIEMSLAEIRKYGGCFVIGTQMVSQLNKIYGHEIAKTITGLCGTKIVMGIPEPETARYMSNFLGEKEEVSTTEGISYGANTIRDGVNIAQKTEKKQTVPYTEIMDLTPGEAFIRFSSVNMVAKTKFKLHKITEAKQEKEASKIISLQEYVGANPPAENDLLFCGIPLNDGILSKPIYVFDSDTSKISELLTEARRLNRKVIVFENDSRFYDACFKEGTDILLNPHKENGRTWNILKEFDEDYEILTQILTAKFNEKDLKNAQRYLMTVFMNMDNIFTEINVNNVLNTTIFAPIKNVAKTLSRILDLDSQEYFNIRTDLMIYNKHLALLLNDKDNVAVKDYISDKSYDGKIMFVSCFNDAKMKEIMRIVVNHCTIQEALTIHDTSHAKNKKTIILCNENSRILEDDGSIIATYDLAQSNKIFDSIFGSALQNRRQNPQFLAKIHGVSEIIY